MDSQVSNRPFQPNRFEAKDYLIDLPLTNCDRRGADVGGWGATKELPVAQRVARVASGGCWEVPRRLLEAGLELLLGRLVL